MIDPISNNTNSLQFAPSTGSFVSSQDIGDIARRLASQMGIPDSVALRVVRKFIGSGGVPNLKTLEEFIKTESGKLSPDLVKQAASKESERLGQNKISQAEQNSQASLRPLLKELKLNLSRDRNQEIKKEVENLFTRKPESNPSQIPNDRIPVTKLVSSPQAFASWLVNNKAAFIALRSNPEATYLLTALQNPLLMQSPVVVSEIAKLIAQLLRLKQGKQTGDSLDDDLVEDRQQETLLEAEDKQHTIVNNAKGSAEVVEVKSLKDFLLEAERFAEEEVANLWSLTLKKERELEKKLKDGIQSLGKQKPNNKK